MEDILIIDDSLVQASVLKNILKEDYRVEICPSGRHGVQVAQEQPFSLILLDVIMPGWDGFEVLAQLKQKEGSRDIPVILITSLSDVGNEEKGLRLGAVDYIVKPFNAHIVKARVHTHTQLYAYRRTFADLALLDGLTGIPNRRNYDERCLREWGRAAREGGTLSIGLIDIDYFKQYNDRYGHPKGDEVLREVARAIAGRLHPAVDFAGRYGGEEFVFLLPDTSWAHSVGVAEEIRAGVEALRIPHTGSGVSEYVTVSIGGMTAAPGPGDQYEAAFQLVDGMLYRAKNCGRNQVVWAKAGDASELMGASPPPLTAGT